MLVVGLRQGLTQLIGQGESLPTPPPFSHGIILGYFRFPVTIGGFPPGSPVCPVAELHIFGPLQEICMPPPPTLTNTFLLVIFMLLLSFFFNEFL